MVINNKITLKTVADEVVIFLLPFCQVVVISNIKGLSKPLMKYHFIVNDWLEVDSKGLDKYLYYSDTEEGLWGKRNIYESENHYTMSRYKVEAYTYYSKLTTNRHHIIDKSTDEIQTTLDNYAEDGYRLVSTDTTSFGAAVYVYLYFEKIDA